MCHWCCCVVWDLARWRRWRRCSWTSLRISLELCLSLSVYVLSIRMHDSTPPRWYRSVVLISTFINHSSTVMCYITWLKTQSYAYHIILSTLVSHIGHWHDTVMWFSYINLWYALCLWQVVQQAEVHPRERIRTGKSGTFVAGLTNPHLRVSSCAHCWLNVQPHSQDLGRIRWLALRCWCCLM